LDALRLVCVVELVDLLPDTDEDLFRPPPCDWAFCDVAARPPVPLPDEARSPVAPRPVDFDFFAEVKPFLFDELSFAPLSARDVLLSRTALFSVDWDEDLFSRPGEASPFTEAEKESDF
jgi:hypothetical protein